MEVDNSAFIFGSFSRRRPAEEGASGKRRSGGAALGLGASRPNNNDKYTCTLCRKPFSEPRVLPCLHTFCTRCLLELRHPDGHRIHCRDDISEATYVTFNGKADVSGSNSGSGSAASGYESEQRDSSDGSWNTHHNVEKSPRKKQFGVYIRKVSGKELQILICPVCGLESRLPSAGVLALPLNFVLQHRMFVAALNQDTSRLLCDLCSADVPASTRCTTCLVSLCVGCGAAHAKCGESSRHAMLPLADAARRGALTLRRQPMCPRHPDNELKLFCTTCCQVICRDCCLVQHNGHSFEPVCRAAESYVRSIREAVDRVKPVTRQTTTALEKLQSIGKRIQIKTGIVQEEVDQFIDSYIRAVEEHRQTLQMQVLKARDVKVQILTKQKTELEKRAINVKDAIEFAEDILSEGTDVEVLSIVGPLLRRLEWCSNTEGLFDTGISENFKLIKEEKAALYGGGNFQLYGVISTRNVDPSLCTINHETLRGVRAHRPQEVLLETKDATDQPLCRGGESVTGLLRRAGTRPRPVAAKDRKDGTYLITFIPDAPGALQLAILVNGKPIKGSPFNMMVRNLRPHVGKFHCCTFCSSGGNKEAECACGGQMAGGYKGCGHGHEGHPGMRHWSCCGNIQQNSECIRTNSAMYQFSL